MSTKAIVTTSILGAALIAGSLSSADASQAIPNRSDTASDKLDSLAWPGDSEQPGVSRKKAPGKKNPGKKNPAKKK
jgi:hypothetical protein